MWVRLANKCCHFNPPMRPYVGHCVSLYSAVEGPHHYNDTLILFLEHGHNNTCGLQHSDVKGERVYLYQCLSFSFKWPVPVVFSTLNPTVPLKHLYINVF